jgi:hypothetical protein
MISHLRRCHSDLLAQGSDAVASVSIRAFQTCQLHEVALVGIESFAVAVRSIEIGEVKPREAKVTNLLDEYCCFSECVHLCHDSVQVPNLALFA